MFASSDFEPVVNAVLAAPPRLGPVRLVAVDGPSGSGKSTYAAGLVAAFAAALAEPASTARVSPDVAAAAPAEPHRTAPAAPPAASSGRVHIAPAEPHRTAPAAAQAEPRGRAPVAPAEPHRTVPAEPRRTAPAAAQAEPRGRAPVAPGEPDRTVPASPHRTAPAAASAESGGVALVSTDDFATWENPVAWWPRLVDGVLRPLSQGRPGRYRRTEWTDGTPHPGACVTIATPHVLVLEGVSAGRRSLSSSLSALVWLELPQAERLERAVARDGESSRESLTTWQNFESGWFAVDGAARRATHRPSTGGGMSAERTKR